MKTGKAPGFSDLLFDLKAASMEVRIQVMAEISLSHRFIWNASQMDSKYSYSKFVKEMCYLELHVLWIHDAA